MLVFTSIWGTSWAEELDFMGTMSVWEDEKVLKMDGGTICDCS